MWARLLGQLGLRPNAEDEAAEQKRLAGVASQANTAAAQTEAERATADLAQQKAQVELARHDTGVAAAEKVLKVVRHARDVAASFDSACKGITARPDTPDARHKEQIMGTAAGHLRAADDDVKEAERHLAAVDAERTRARAAIAAAQANLAAKAAKADAAGSAASQAAAAASAAPPQRFWELKGHVLANEPDGKKGLLDVVAALMAPRLIDDSKTPPVDRRGGTILVDEAHNLDPKTTPNGRSVLQYLLTIAEDNKQHITVILTGYKKQIDEKLLTVDPGLCVA